jgi:hypothetical protein
MAEGMDRREIANMRNQKPYRDALISMYQDITGYQGLKA